MLEFRQPTLSDKERIERMVRASGQIGCDVSFVNTYLWRHRYGIKVAFTEDSYFKCYQMGEKVTGYAMPLTTGDIKTAVNLIRRDAKERGAQPLIGLLNPENAALIKKLYGRRVKIAEDRDSFDYIYQRQMLANLPGKPYHAKRNHISRFIRTYQDYSVEEICESNFDDVLAVTEQWMNGAEDTGELEIIRDALAHFDELSLFGLLLYVDEQPVAMSLGSAINDEVCDVNFEKAVKIDEAYAVINNEFAKHFSTFSLFNREEDMGLEGLRKSKLSYHPDILLSKSIAVFR